MKFCENKFAVISELITPLDNIFRLYKDIVFIAVAVYYIMNGFYDGLHILKNQ